MHLIRVDLPEPEGPHTTTTSPFATSVEQPLSTWTMPYHLLRSRTLIMGREPQRTMATRRCSRRTQCEAASEIAK